MLQCYLRPNVATISFGIKELHLVLVTRVICEPLGNEIPKMNLRYFFQPLRPVAPNLSLTLNGSEVESCGSGTTFALVEPSSVRSIYCK